MLSPYLTKNDFLLFLVEAEQRSSRDGPLIIPSEKSSRMF